MTKTDFGTVSNINIKAELLQLNRTQFPSRPWEFLLVKKLEIEKTKTTFITPVLKVV